MKLNEILTGYIGIWLSSLLMFVYIVTLVVVAFMVDGGWWMALIGYLAICAVVYVWENWPSLKIELGAITWIFVTPAIVALAFVIYLPYNIKRFIDSPTPKLKNFNQH